MKQGAKKNLGIAVFIGLLLAGIYFAESGDEGNPEDALARRRVKISRVAQVNVIENSAATDEGAATEKARQKIRRLAPTNNPAYADEMAAAQRALNTGNFDEALKRLAAAHEREPRSLEPLMQSAEISLLRHDLENAASFAEKALLLDAINRDALLLLARTRMRQLRLHEAKEIMLEIKPPFDESLFLEAIIHAALNEEEPSRKLLTEVIEYTNNQELQMQAQLTFNQFETFRITEDAEPIFLQALLANAFDSIGEAELAIALAEEGLAAKNDYRDLWIIKGHAYLTLNKTAEARDALREATALDAQSGEGFFFLGIAEQRLGTAAEAHKAFNRAAQLGYEPKILVTQEHAPVLFELGMYSEAMAAYEAILQYDATDISRFIKPISIALEKLQDFEKARSLATWALQLHQENAVAYALSGWASLGSGELRAAELALQKSLQIDPKLLLAELILARVGEANGNSESALEQYEKIYSQAKAAGETEVADLANAWHDALSASLSATIES